jgi:hypothetical protein
MIGPIYSDAWRVPVLEKRIKELEEALAKIRQQQPKTLAMIRNEGFIFESIGNERGNWQHLAFSIYTDLCEVDMIARQVLPEQDPGPKIEK